MHVWRDSISRLSRRLRGFDDLRYESIRTRRLGVAGSAGSGFHRNEASMETGRQTNSTGLCCSASPSISSDVADNGAESMPAWNDLLPSPSGLGNRNMYGLDNSRFARSGNANRNDFKRRRRYFGFALFNLPNHVADYYRRRFICSSQEMRGEA